MVNNFIKLIISIALPFIAGAAGSLATMSEIDSWYSTLTKPVFNPPNWIFGPVWTLLYLLMGIALYRVWISSTSSSRKAVLLFMLHLVLNAAWSVAFFGLNSPLLGLLVIVALLAFIIYLVKSFFIIDKIAGRLLIPYLLWSSFATLLNISILYLN